MNLNGGFMDEWFVCINFTNEEEFEIVREFERKNDLSILGNYLLTKISNSRKGSHEMTKYMEAVMKGKSTAVSYKPLRRRYSNFDRDLSIAYAMHQELKESPLRENSTKKVSASSKVAKEFFLSEDRVINIYYSFPQYINKDRQLAWAIERQRLFLERSGIYMNEMEIVFYSMMGERSRATIDSPL
jgi:hypothetical protein